jgi:transposase
MSNLAASTGGQGDLRRQVWALYKQGKSAQQIATTLGVTLTRVLLWLQQAQLSEDRLVENHPKLAAYFGLTSLQVEQLRQHLCQSPYRFGLKGQGWNQAKISAHLKRH